MITRDMKVVDAYPLIGKQLEDIFIMIEHIQSSISSGVFGKEDVEYIHKLANKVQDIINQRACNRGAIMTVGKVSAKALATVRHLRHDNNNVFYDRCRIETDYKSIFKGE